MERISFKESYNQKQKQENFTHEDFIMSKLFVFLLMTNESQAKNSQKLPMSKVSCIENVQNLYMTYSTCKENRTFLYMNSLKNSSFITHHS